MIIALKKNILKIYVIVFFEAFMVIVPVMVPLLQSHGLSMSQVLYTQAVFALAIAICEVPAGYLADLWGRKNTLLLGTSFAAVGYGWLQFSSSFDDFIIFEILLGIAMSLTSGVDLALLYDSNAALQRLQKGHADDSGKVIGRLVTIASIAEATGGLLASALVLYSLQSIPLAQAIIGLLPLLVTMTLVEPPRQKSEGRHRDNANLMFAMVRDNRLILWTIIGLIAFGLACIYAFWLHQKYWELQAIPIGWYGLIWAAYCLARATGAHVAVQLERGLGIQRLLPLLALLPIAGYLGMALTNSWLGVLLGMLFPVSRGIMAVVLYSALNSRLPSAFRATINSMVNLGMRAIFILTGPLLGYLADAEGVIATQLMLAGLFLPILGIVAASLLRAIKQDELLTEKLELEISKDV
ncbi:MAG: MFS transporter [Pseudomonadales bacterium]